MLGQVEADLALLHAGFAGDRVQQLHLVAGAGAPHRAGLQLLTRAVGDLHGRLRLPEPVPDGDAPGAPHLLDDLGVQRLPRGDDRARRRRELRQVGLDEHAPHGGRGTEGRDARALHDLHQPARVEARVVVEEDGRLRVPRREEVRPGVLGPAGRRDVQMDVAGTQTDPEHGRQVPYGIRHMGVLDELGPGGRAGGEVQEERVLREGDAVGLERLGGVVGVLVREPAVRGARAARADHGSGEVARDLGELLDVLGPHDDVPGPAAVDAVAQVGGAEQRRRGDDDGPQLHRGEHDLPQLHLVAEHQEDPVARANALAAQPVRDAVRAQAQLVEGEAALAAVLLDDVQGRLPVAVGDGVEPVEGPVEPLGARPGEALVRGGVVVRVPQQEVLAVRNCSVGLGSVPLVAVVMCPPHCGPCVPSCNP